MLIADIGLARTLRLIAATIAIIVAVSLPLGYWLVVYSFVAEATANDAAAHAESLTGRINADPDLWHFEIPRLDAIVAPHHGPGGLPEKHTILDERGAVLAQNAQRLSPPILIRSAPLLDSGTVVGRFVTSRSLLPQLQDVTLLALFALALALAVYVSLSVLPLRALKRMGVALDAEQAALRASEEHFRAIFDRAIDGIMIMSPVGKLVAVNESFARMHGYSVEEMLAMNLKDLDAPETSRLAPERLQSSLSGEPLIFEVEHYHKDGHIFPMEVSVSLIVSGGETLIQAFHRDITERKQVEQALRDATQELRLFAENIPAMTASFDTALRCRFANKAFAEFYGFTVESIRGKSAREIVEAGAYADIEGYFAQVLQGHPVTYQRTRKLPNGESHYLEAKLLPNIGEQGKMLGCFAVTTDITDHRLAEERIRLVAHHDSLTGLPNRLLFNDRLQQAISLAKRDTRQFALLYLDLDRFKQVNDSLGHRAGDELLQAIASRIRNQVRESDTVARVGGDEFTVILSNIARREEAEIVARKIIAAVAAPFLIGSQQRSVEIGTSIGISIYPTDGQDADTLVNAADTAMYGAKQVGGSYRLFAEEKKGP